MIEEELEKAIEEGTWIVWKCLRGKHTYTEKLVQVIERDYIAEGVIRWWIRAQKESRKRSIDADEADLREATPQDLQEYGVKR